MADLADMHARRRLRLAWFAAVSSFASLGLAGGGLLEACATDETTAAPGSEAGGADSGRESGGDASPGDFDAATTTDSADAGVIIVNGPGEAGVECSFNRDCNAVLRCACVEGQGCVCEPGTRGTGRNGIDPCNDSNACASAVCVEGPPDSGSFCSDECDSSADCTGKLPLCSTIAFVGRICIRTPP